MRENTGRHEPGVRPARRRIPLLALGGVALVTGIWGGLLRLGVRLPMPSAVMIADHGPLMVSGFLGTLIGVERAVALERGWAYAAPLLTGLGGIALLFVVSVQLGVVALAAGSAVFVVASLRIVVRQPASFTITMAAGALAWLVGNVLWWTGRPVFSVVWWWAGFLLLTIAGERLELSRLMRRPEWASTAFFGACAVFVLGLGASTWWPQTGPRVTGAGMIAVALWLGFFDLARRTVRQKGLPRYVAVCLLSGYVWLAITGASLLVLGELTAGAQYDAALHAFFVGFVFSMIFGHAPIVFPAVLRVAVPYRPLFHLPLALLHLALIARVSGDLGGVATLRLWGGALNAVAIVAFIGSLVGSVIHGETSSADASKGT